jgi:murein DD-endopeptidase MepM/ murein hydrolase activator NlpD
MRYQYLFGLFFLVFSVAAHAQETETSCGVVDAIRLPMDNIVELTRGYDDFGLYRERFGGLHTGFDMGFDRLGDPIYAAARGRVTYSDPVGWDTEKGVVIIEHLFPDNRIYYTVYGHVEQTDTIFLAPVGTCVEMGDIIAAEGWPSRGRPHLHYEVRTFLPNDGGPGYVLESPLLEGWLQPFDFTMLWQVRLMPGYITSATFQNVPSLPPVSLDSGGYAIASADAVEGVDSAGMTLWRVQGDGVITGLAALSDNRVVAHTRNGLAMVLQDGSYRALWYVQGPEEPLIVMPNTDTLIFVTHDGLAAYDAAGTTLWSAQTPIIGRVIYFGASATQIMLAIRDGDRQMWSLFDAANGTLVASGDIEASFTATSSSDGSWYWLDSLQVSRYADGQLTPLDRIGQLAGRTARMIADSRGVYIYTADVSNTLLAINPLGEILWRVTYPYEGALTLAPLIASDTDCLLYTLDANGMMNAFNVSDGQLLRQTQLYAGGSLTGSPPARVLLVNPLGQVEIGAGFLSVITMDGRTLVGSSDCLAG